MGAKLAEFFDWNPARGTWYEIEDDPQSGGVAIHTRQDVKAALNDAKERRNSGLTERKAKKTDFLHYARIPAHVELEIKQKYGISIYDKNETRKLLKIINRDYPFLKTSSYTHNV